MIPRRDEIDGVIPRHPHPSSPQWHSCRLGMSRCPLPSKKQLHQPHPTERHTRCCVRLGPPGGKYSRLPDPTKSSSALACLTRSSVNAIPYIVRNVPSVLRQIAQSICLLCLLVGEYSDRHSSKSPQVARY